MIIGIVAGLSPPATAHTIQYQVENKGISVRIFSGPDKPISYSAYEIFGPSDKIPHQKGRTDKNGFVSFLPDRQGKWVVQVQEDSDHGPHGARITIEVNQNLFMKSFKKPLVAQYTKGLVGVSFILAIFGIWALLKSKRRKNGLA
ncbi:MAG: hypothetical protein HY879_04265 [Deltaproteobacteria bacterium]|nr:hypothetical protein [Deltaproteobacteria bacterium]